MKILRSGKTSTPKIKALMSKINILTTATAIALSNGAATAQTPAAPFGPANPFYAASTLPFYAPPFDKIKDTDYQPAIEAGMAEQLKEMRAIADNPAPPTFDNTLVAMEKTGALFERVMAAFEAVTGANTNPALQKVEELEAPKLAAHNDVIYLDSQLYERVAAIYKQRDSLKLDAESQRLLEVTYKKFVHAGANLSDSDKVMLKKLNEEESTLSNAFKNKLLSATRDAAYFTQSKQALAGLSDAQISAAAQAAEARSQRGYLIPLQNTTQQPFLVSLSDRATRQALFENSWQRAERGGANDTRDTIARLAQLRAEKAKLLGFPTYAAWKLENQMAETPEAALKFMDALVPATTANAVSEGKEIQAVIDAQNGSFQLQPWDWNFYRTASFSLPTSSTGSPSRSARTSLSTTPTCASSRSPTPTESRWPSSTVIISSGTIRTAEPG
jgi:peptidyl-dipeptidase Dcp